MKIVLLSKINKMSLLFCLLFLSLFSVNSFSQMNTVLNVSMKGIITAGGVGTTASSGTFSIGKPSSATSVNKIFVYQSSMAPGINGLTINGVSLILTQSTSSTTVAGTNNCYYDEFSTSATATPLLNTLNAAAPGSSSVFSVVEGGNAEGVGMIVLWNAPTNLYVGAQVIQLGSLPSGPGGASSSFPISALDNTLAGFSATMGIGITYSTGMAGQNSVLTIGNSTPTVVVSSNCGGYNDGMLSNGALFTIGGTGDNPVSNDSDELFDVASFLVNGQTTISYNLLDEDTVYDDFLNALYFTSSGILPPCPAGSVAPVITP